MDSAEVQAEPAKPIPASPSQATGTVSREYEFSENENAVFVDLAVKMSFVGLFTMVSGFFVIAIGIYSHDPGTIIMGSLYSLMGIWTHRASVSFRNIKDTQGKDVSHLMHAIRDLQRLYTVNFWLCIVSVVAVFVVILIFQRQ
jgi:hypothetical protein